MNVQTVVMAPVLVFVGALMAATVHAQDAVVVTPTMEFPADGVWHPAFGAIEGWRSTGTWRTPGSTRGG